MTFAHVVYAFLNPAGRSNRRGLLVSAGALLTLQMIAVVVYFGFDLPKTGTSAQLCHVAFLWLAFVAMSKRLHDLSLSAWWIGKAMASVVVSTVILAIGLMFFMEQSAFEPGGKGYLIVVLGNMVPIFVMTMWVHFQRGVDVDNRYGPVPAGWSGFTFPSTLNQTSPLPVEAH
jgi:uncharacterized membrane protein YhaH (DUF805 family)